MKRIGILGSIGSGKSYVAKSFGYPVFNADKESKKHLKRSHGLQKKIINTFGQSIVNENKIDLNLLAQKAFSSKTNHKILNGILWPEILVLQLLTLPYLKLQLRERIQIGEGLLWPLENQEKILFQTKYK